MSDKESEFVAKALTALKALKALQRQISGLEKQINRLDKRIRYLELEEPDEMVLRNAKGNLDLYLIRNEEGNYVEPPAD